MRIKLEHLSIEKEIEINSNETLYTLKTMIEELYSIPQDQQALYFEDRILSNHTKMLEDLGIKCGSMLKVKKVKKVTGASENGMKTLLKDSMFKNMMNSSTLENMKNMFPDLKEQMEENSSLKMLLTNDNMEEELSKFASNDDYANIQMRNNDVVMAKLENTPEGIRLMNSLTNEAGNLTMPKPCVDLKKGSESTTKPDKPLPGACKRNLLIEFRKELLLLSQIGFDNAVDNITALQATNGDIEEATFLLENKYKNN